MARGVETVGQPAQKDVIDVDRELMFGYFLVPNAGDPLLETARLVERLGLDYVAVQDHPYQRRYVDTFALMSAILATTTSVRVFPDVANLPLRPPAVLAKTAATLDLLSDGRFHLGLGAGGFWDAIDGYGGTRRTPGEALDQLAEGIEVIRKLWSGERNLRYEGDYYHLRGVHSGPGSDARHRHLDRRRRPAVVATDRPAGRRLGAVGPSRRRAQAHRDERQRRRGCR